MGQLLQFRFHLEAFPFHQVKPRPGWLFFLFLRFTARCMPIQALLPTVRGSHGLGDGLAGWPSRAAICLQELPCRTSTCRRNSQDHRMDRGAVSLLRLIRQASRESALPRAVNGSVRCQLRLPVSTALSKRSLAIKRMIVVDDRC